MTWNRSIQSQAAICLALPVATYQSPLERRLGRRDAAPAAFDIGGKFRVPDRKDVGRRGGPPRGCGVAAATAAVCRGVPNTAEQHVGFSPSQEHPPRQSIHTTTRKYHHKFAHPAKCVG